MHVTWESANASLLIGEIGLNRKQAALFGYLEHIMLYPINTDPKETASRRWSMPIACSTPSVLAAYQPRWMVSPR